MKKAQLQMQETILVIFIITIIIALGLFAFYKYNLNSIEKFKLELDVPKYLKRTLNVLLLSKDYQMKKMLKVHTALILSKHLHWLSRKFPIY